MWAGIGSTGIVMALLSPFTIDLLLPGGLIEGHESLTLARTAGFTVQVFAQLFNCFSARSETRSAFHGLFANRWLWASVVLSATLQVAVVHVPFRCSSGCFAWRLPAACSGSASFESGFSARLPEEGTATNRCGQSQWARLGHEIANCSCGIRRSDPTRKLFTGDHMTTFAVSRVRLDDGGRITAVLWGEVDTVRNSWATPEIVAAVAAAVDALRAGDLVFALFPSTHGHVPERRFVIADYDGDRETIVLDGPATHEREVHDMDRLDGPAR